MTILIAEKNGFIREVDKKGAGAPTETWEGALESIPPREGTRVSPDFTAIRVSVCFLLIPNDRRAMLPTFGTMGLVLIGRPTRRASSDRSQ